MKISMRLFIGFYGITDEDREVIDEQ